MPDVKMPDGTIVKNVPEGTTKAELMRRLGKSQAAPAEAPDVVEPPTEDGGLLGNMANAGVRMGAKALSFAPLMAMDLGVASRNVWQTPLKVGGKEFNPFSRGEAPEYELPSAMFNRELDARTTAPNEFAGKAAEFLGSSAAGSLLPNPTVATAPANFVLNKAAEKIFAPQALEFAKSKGAPFPLSSAAPKSAAGKLQTASRGLLPGEIRTQLDANKVAQFLNREVGTQTAKAEVFDDVAKQGQQFLREVFEPGEKAIKGVFTKYAEAVGDDSLVPTRNTLAAVSAAADKLANRGQTTGGLYQRLRTILKRAPDSFTTREFDELYGAIIKQSFTSKAGAGGEGRMVLEAITKDLDEFGKTAGISFADDLGTASATREAFRDLRKIPQLERLAAEFGQGGSTKGTIDWMNTLFTSGNGKALAKMRELNAPLYHDLADAYLARQIEQATKSSAVGRALDGHKLRSWFVQNQDKIKEIYGAPQAKALDHFSSYAEAMSGAVERSATGKGLDPQSLLFRGGAEAAATFKAPFILIPGQGASYLLAKGLSDPNSALFRLFTEGVRPSTIRAMQRSGQAAGALATQEITD